MAKPVITNRRNAQGYTWIRQGSGGYWASPTALKNVQHQLRVTNRPKPQAIRPPVRPRDVSDYLPGANVTRIPEGVSRVEELRGGRSTGTLKPKPKPKPKPKATVKPKVAPKAVAPAPPRYRPPAQVSTRAGGGSGVSVGTGGGGGGAAPVPVVRQQQAPVRAQAAQPPPARERSIDDIAREQVLGAVDPVVAEITRQLNERSRQGQASITGNANAQAEALGPLQAQLAGVYGGAMSRQSDIDNSLANRMQGSGQDFASQLTAKLAAINAPAAAIQQTAGSVNEFGTGAANAGYASGTISMGDLNAQGAAAETYASKLPGIARLGGIQASGELERELSRALSEQVGEIRSKVPGMVLETRAGIEEGRRKDQALAQNERITNYKLGLDTERVNISKQNANTGRLNTELRALQNDRNWQATLKKLGIQEANLSLRASELEAKRRSGGFTPLQTRNLSAEALETARADFDGGYTDNGGDFIDTGKKRPQETLADLIASGIPFSIAIKAIQRFWPHTKSWTKK